MQEPRYFIRQQGGPPQGPFSWNAIQRYAAEGRVRPEMEFSEDGSNWWLGADWGALFPSPPPKPAAYVRSTRSQRPGVPRRASSRHRRTRHPLRRPGKAPLVITILVLAVGVGAALTLSLNAPAPTRRESRIPPWAHVSKAQIAAARKHSVPVAFENPLGMRFVLIPAGKFMMGSTEEERQQAAKEGGGEVDLSNQGVAADPNSPSPERMGAEWMDDETLHEVTLSRPFYMAIYEVSNAEYALWDPSHESGDFMGLSLALPNQPVVRVTWNHASEFADWMSRRMEREYRLPTEAEWEYACRAGTSTRYHWGSEIDSGHLHANGNDVETSRILNFSWPRWPEDDGHRVAAPVGSFLPNAFGLHDMSGNVWEWCQDWYGPLAESPVRDPLASTERSASVTRGGSWYEMPALLRPAARNFGGSKRVVFDQGFRLVSPCPTHSD